MNFSASSFKVRAFRSSWRVWLGSSPSWIRFRALMAFLRAGSTPSSGNRPRVIMVSARRPSGR